MSETFAPEQTDITPSSPAPVVESNLAPSNDLNAPGAGEHSPALMQRPDWVPEKFFKDGVINYKDLAQSYKELEKGHSQTPAAKGEGATQEQQPIQQAPLDIPTVPGVEAERINFFTQEITTQGKLSDTSYSELDALGYPKAVVDVYVAGLMKDVAVQDAIEYTRQADAQIADVKASIGGEAVLQDMLQWAKVNLSDPDKKVYDAAVNSGDAARMKMAVNGLHSRFISQHGREPQYVNVGGNRLPGASAAEPFNNSAEVAAAMAKPQYKTDANYRAQVAERLRVSDVFSSSRDTSTIQRL